MKRSFIYSQQEIDSRRLEKNGEKDVYMSIREDYLLV